MLLAAFMLTGLTIWLAGIPLFVTGNILSPARPDELHNFYTVEWTLYAWRNGLPVPWMNIFGGHLPTLYLSEQFWIPAEISGVFQAAGMTSRNAYLSTIVLFLLLNVLSLCWLAWTITGHWVLACSAAALFVFGGYAQHDILQVMIRMPVFHIPVLLLTFVRAIETPDWRWRAGFGSVFLISTLLPIGYLVIAAVALAISAAAIRPKVISLIKLTPWTLPAGIAALFIYLHYRAAHAELGLAFQSREFGEAAPGMMKFFGLLPGIDVSVIAICALACGFIRMVTGTAVEPAKRFHIPLLALLLVAAGTGLAGLEWSGRLERTTVVIPGLLWPSVAIYFFAAAAVFAAARTRSYGQWLEFWNGQTTLWRSLAALSVAGLLLALNHRVCWEQKCLAYGPIVGLQALMPPLGMIRGPERFLLLVSLSLPALAYGWLWTRSKAWPHPARLSLLAVIAALAAAQSYPATFRFSGSPDALNKWYWRDEEPFSKELPQIYRELLTRPRALTLELMEPDNLRTSGAVVSWLSTFHWFPLVNGYSSYYPAGYEDGFRQLIVPGPELPERLRRAGVRYVLIHDRLLSPELKTQYATALGPWRSWQERQNHQGDWIADLETPANTSASTDGH